MVKINEYVAWSVYSSTGKAFQMKSMYVLYSQHAIVALYYSEMYLLVSYGSRLVPVGDVTFEQASTPVTQEPF